MRGLFISMFVVMTLLASSLGAQSRNERWQRTLEQVALGSAARIVILDRASGSVIAAKEWKAATRTLAAPGSVLKPLLLYRALETRQWDSSNHIVCHRQLVIASHRLACSHPETPPLDAREALAWSCNSYFARMARALRPGQLVDFLRPTGLLDPTGLATGEAVAEFREPAGLEEQQLAMLGVSNIRVTPLELAVAYRWLANEMAAHPESAAARTVAAGLVDSANFGIASGAGSSGASVAGKTGTAEGTRSSRTHGWFAGLAPAENPQIVIVVYLPSGRGADAAQVAGRVLAKARLLLR